MLRHKKTTEDAETNTDTATSNDYGNNKAKSVGKDSKDKKVKKKSKEIKKQKREIFGTNGCFFKAAKNRNGVLQTPKGKVVSRTNNKNGIVYIKRCR